MTDATELDVAAIGAHEQYLMALDDAFGLVNNRLAIVRAARQEQGR